jgi:SAM-dependent methyltransferase
VGLGHAVRLIDPVPLHIEQAAAASPRVEAELGDARALAGDDGAYDVVLLLGPLYHLLDPGDRQLALREAQRVLRPGGRLFAAAISRSSALLDLLVRLDRLHEPGVLEVVADAVRTGEFRGAEHGLFTNAYFHRPSELRREVTDAGFADTEVLNVEGPGFLVADFERRWADPDRRQALLDSARLVEADPEMLGAAGHLLAVARRS